jgi:hypothetical protein
MDGRWAFSSWTFLVFSAAYSGKLRWIILRKVQASDCEIGGSVVSMAGDGSDFA